MKTKETPAEAPVAGSPEALIAEKIAWLETCSAALDERGIAVLEEIFRPFMDAHYNRVLRRIRRAGIREAEAEDLLQEAFAAFFYRVKRHGGQIGLRKMLAQNTRWKILNYVRDEDCEPDTVGMPSSESALPESAVDVDRAVDVRELARLFREDLSPEHRAVVDRTLLGDLTDIEAAADLGIPVGTLKSRLRAAIRVLRELAARLTPSQRDAA